MPKVTTAHFTNLAFLPLQPAQPVAETLEWLSDLMQSHNGTEEILQLRSAPRQTFSYTIPEQAWQKVVGFNTEYQALTKQWGVPVWTEAQFVGAIANGTTALTVPTNVYSFRSVGLVFIWQDDSHFQVLEIDTVSDGSLALHTATNGYTGAYVMPMRVGHVAGPIQRRSNGDNVQTTVNFEIDDGFDVGSGSAPTQFLGDDIYFDLPLFENGSVNYSINSRVDLVDYALGPIARRPVWLHNRVDYQRNVLCATAAEVRAYKQWLVRRAGKFKRFWEPSFENDLRKQSTGTVNTTFLFASDNITDWSALPRNHVAFELDDGTWLARTVSSITTVSGTQSQLNLDTTLAVPASRIRRVSWLGLKRLNADRVDLNWIGGGVMQSHTMVTELQP